MPRKVYDKELSRRWQRFYLAREKLNLLTARKAAGLDLHSGMMADECAQLADLTAWLRGIEFRAYAHPDTANAAADYADLITVASECLFSGGTQIFRDKVSDVLADTHASKAAWEQAATTPTPLTDYRQE